MSKGVRYWTADWQEIVPRGESVSVDTQLLRLHNLPQRQDPRPKIYGLEPNGHENGWVEFDHLDGMYSFCVAYDGEGNRLGVVHLAGYMPLLPEGDGYRPATPEGAGVGDADA